MSKKSVLIVYSEMMIGGSTTSLLSMLQNLDYSKYDVDLLLDFNKGELLNKIPEEVNLLPQGRYYQNATAERQAMRKNPKLMWYFLISKIVEKKSGSVLQGKQYFSAKDTWKYREITKEYDVAISFIEGKQFRFIARHVNAKKKIAWLHINYKDAKMCAKYDRADFAKIDTIVTVSADCKKDFDNMFPEFKDKTVVVENILSNEYVRKRAEEEEFNVDSNKLNLVSVCRISFVSKGLDRGVEAIARLKKEGKTDKLKWYIVGDGGDKTALEQMIAENDLSDTVILLGSKKNPYPYLKNMSMFFTPSRFEGKPMAVTEALMMGLPVLATEYSSAREQINDGVDGYINENSTDGIYNGLKYCIEHPEKVSEWQSNVRKTDYSNVEEMKKIEKLIG